jgi:hypothetical protein
MWKGKIEQSSIDERDHVIFTSHNPLSNDQMTSRTVHYFSFRASQAINASTAGQDGYTTLSYPLSLTHPFDNISPFHTPNL